MWHFSNDKTISVSSPSMGAYQSSASVQNLLPANTVCQPLGQQIGAFSVENVQCFWDNKKSMLQSGARRVTRLVSKQNLDMIGIYLCWGQFHFLCNMIGSQMCDWMHCLCCGQRLDQPQFSLWKECLWLPHRMSMCRHLFLYENGFFFHFPRVFPNDMFASHCYLCNKHIQTRKTSELLFFASFHFISNKYISFYALKHTQSYKINLHEICPKILMLHLCIQIYTYMPIHTYVHICVSVSFCCKEPKVGKRLDLLTYIKCRQSRKQHGYEGRKKKSKKLMSQQNFQVMINFFFLNFC